MLHLHSRALVCLYFSTLLWEGKRLCRCCVPLLPRYTAQCSECRKNTIINKLSAATVNVIKSSLRAKQKTHLPSRNFCPSIVLLKDSLLFCNKPRQIHYNHVSSTPATNLQPTKYHLASKKGREEKPSPNSLLWPPTGAHNHLLLTSIQKLKRVCNSEKWKKKEEKKNLFCCYLNPKHLRSWSIPSHLKE